MPVPLNILVSILPLVVVKLAYDFWGIGLVMGPDPGHSPSLLQTQLAWVGLNIPPPLRWSIQ